MRIVQHVLRPRERLRSTRGEEHVRRHLWRLCDALETAAPSHTAHSHCDGKQAAADRATSGAADN